MYVYVYIYIYTLENLLPTRVLLQLTTRLLFEQFLTEVTCRGVIRMDLIETVEHHCSSKIDGQNPGTQMVPNKIAG